MGRRMSGFSRFQAWSGLILQYWTSRDMSSERLDQGQGQKYRGIQGKQLNIVKLNFTTISLACAMTMI